MSWKMYIEDGTAAVKRADYAAAERSLKEALSFAKEGYGRNDSRIALTLSLLGHVYFHMKDFARAERLLEQSLRLHAETKNLNDPCLFMDLFSLAEIKQSAGKPSEACRLYDETVDKMASGRPHSATKVQDAAKAFRKLSETARKQRDAATTDGAVSTASLANGAKSPEPQVTEPTASEPATASATAAAKNLSLPQLGGTKDGDPGTLDGVWQHQFQTGLASMKTDEPECDELVTAYLNLESAYRLAASMFPKNDMRLIATVKALADASAKLKMFHQAEMLYRQALEQARASEQNAAAAGNSLKLALALMYMESGQFQQAEAIFKEESFDSVPNEAASLRKRLQEANQLIRVFNQAQDLLSQAIAADQAGDLEKAAKLSNNALSQLKQGFPPQHIENARILHYRSAVLKRLGNEEQGIELEQRAQRIETADEAKRAEWDKLVEELPKVDVSPVAV